LGKKESKTETDTTPWAPMQPHILGAAQDIRNTVGRNQGMLDTLSERLQGQLPGLMTQAFGAQPGVAAATGYANDVLGGKYLGQGNPYLNNMLSQTRENVGNAVNGTFSMAGRTGGGNHVERLGQGLASAENQLRYQDYGAERDRMTQQGALVPSLAQAQYAGIQPFLAANSQAAQLPYAGIQALSPLLGQASGAGTTTGTQPGGWGNQLIGAAAAALPFLSDPKAKENIELVGKLDSGLGLYEWDYKADIGISGRWRGVMADEVAEVMPWLLGPKINGYMTVRYSPEKVS